MDRLFFNYEYYASDRWQFTSQHYLAHRSSAKYDFGVADLPKWPQWLQYLMSLAYTFRRALEEELRFCATPSTRDRCLQDLPAFISKGAEPTRMIRLSLAQAGVYIGPEKIAESATFLSSVVGLSTMTIDIYVPDRAAARVAVNSLSEASCDLTIATSKDVESI